MKIWHWILEMCTEEHFASWWLPWGGTWITIGLVLHWIAWKQAPASWPGRPKQVPTRLGLICHELELVCVALVFGPWLLLFHQSLPRNAEIFMLSLAAIIYAPLGYIMHTERRKPPRA